MDKIILGYGFLLSIDGWQATIDRELKQSNLLELDLEGYKKTWTATTKIEFLDDNKITYGAFLDLIESEGSILKAVGLKVTDEEFFMISKREKCYEITDVTDCILNKQKGFKIFTAIIKDKGKYLDSDLDVFIPRKYYNFVCNTIMSLKNEDIKESNLKNTLDTKFKLRDGKYAFCDDEMNFYSGHTSKKVLYKKAD